MLLKSTFLHKLDGWYKTTWYKKTVILTNSIELQPEVAWEVDVQYLALKALHIFAVVIFLGNIIAGLFWHTHAVRTRDPKVISHAMGGIILSDRVFTVPGVIAILMSGVLLAILGGYPLLRTHWILWSIALFSLSGLAFMFRVAPLQRRLLSMARVGAERGDFDYTPYHRLAVRWELWGAVALLAPVAALCVMTLKPTW